jgi:hypothetical protein
MELLLNLIWIMLALGVFCAFARIRRSSKTIPQVPWAKAALALACGLVLLFPIVSASDDLHPVQAVMEDASKRLQQAVGQVSLEQSTSPVAIVPALLATQLLVLLVALGSCYPRALSRRLLDRAHIPADGRAPPFSL